MGTPSLGCKRPVIQPKIIAKDSEGGSMCYTWGTIVVFGVPAVVTVVLWSFLGNQFGAQLTSREFAIFGSKVSLEVIGPTAAYFVFLFIAAQIYPIREDDLMPIRNRLRGTYD